MKRTEEARDRVVAVVPLFQPAPAATAGIRALAAQVDAIVLVDDGSPSDIRAFVDELGIESARLVTSAVNHGIAHALNRGIEEAMRASADLVLTADQDSVFAPDYVARALTAIESLRASLLPFAAVAAEIVDDKVNPSRPLPGSPFRVTLETIQSGMLLPVGVLQRLGPFDESFFIDCVDTDFILRGAQRSLPTFLAPGTRMQHAMGEGIAVRLPAVFGRRERVVPFHGPVRRYYITRNRLRLVRRYAGHSPRWACVQAYEQVRSAAADLVFGAGRRRLLLAIAYGFVDGMRGRGGRIPVELESKLLAAGRMGATTAHPAAAP